MHPLVELLPLLAFIAAYQFGSIYTATGVIMIAMPAVLVAGRLVTGKFSTMHGISTALVLLFGAATLLLHDQRFIQLKPTAFFWALAAAFLGSQWFGRQTLTERVMASALGDEPRLEASAWRALNLAWVAFYAVMGAANLLVARTLPESAWVNFKVFGITGATLLFVLGQGLWIIRRGPPLNRKPDDARTPP